MTPSEILLLQSLKLKQSAHGTYVGVNDPFAGIFEAKVQADPEAFKDEFRNICALISAQLFKEVETLCTALDMSKRGFVQLALIDFVDKANKTITEVNPGEGL